MIFFRRLEFFLQPRFLQIAKIFAICSWLFGTLLFCSYRVPTSHFISETALPDDSRRQAEAAAHILYKFIPRHRSQLRWYDIGHRLAWALFGNDDDGIFGEMEKARFMNEEPLTCAVALKWFLRNPLHNFCFYVIGNAEQAQTEFILFALSSSQSEWLAYKPRAETVFYSQASSLFVGFHGIKPFLSFRICYSNCRETNFYVGWRERGNFGIKLQPYNVSKPRP